VSLPRSGLPGPVASLERGRSEPEIRTAYLRLHPIILAVKCCLRPVENIREYTHPRRAIRKDQDEQSTRPPANGVGQ
jgi:hypothetical protein